MENHVERVVYSVLVIFHDPLTKEVTFMLPEVIGLRGHFATKHAAMMAIEELGMSGSHYKVEEVIDLYRGSAAHPLEAKGYEGGYSDGWNAAMSEDVPF